MKTNPTRPNLIQWNLALGGHPLTSLASPELTRRLRVDPQANRTPSDIGPSRRRDRPTLTSFDSPRDDGFSGQAQVMMHLAWTGFIHPSDKKDSL